MSIKKDFQKLDDLWGSGRYIMLSDEQYGAFRSVLQELVNGGYIVQDTQIDNANNVFRKTDQYDYFIEDINKIKSRKRLHNYAISIKAILGWIFGIVATVSAALILYYFFGIQN